MTIGDHPAADGFRAEVLRLDSSVLLALRGDLDVATVRQFRAAVAGVVGPGPAPTVTVDLSGLDFIDAAGIGALVSLRNTVHETGGTLRVRSARASVLRVLELASVVDLLDAGSAPA